MENDSVDPRPPVFKADCRSAALPEGVRIAAATVCDGLGLFATRSFHGGEALFTSKARLVPVEAVFLFETDFGLHRGRAETHGLALVPSFLKAEPELCKRIAAWAGISGTDPEWVSKQVTDELRRCEMFCGFDDLLNHADQPNTAYDFDRSKVLGEAGSLKLQFPLIALRDLASGEELCIDYWALDPEWIPLSDADWTSRLPRRQPGTP